MRAITGVASREMPWERSTPVEGGGKTLPAAAAASFGSSNALLGRCMWLSACRALLQPEAPGQPILRAAGVSPPGARIVYSISPRASRVGACSRAGHRNSPGTWVGYRRPAVQERASPRRGASRRSPLTMPLSLKAAPGNKTTELRHEMQLDLGILVEMTCTGGCSSPRATHSRGRRDGLWGRHLAHQAWCG